MTHHVKSFAIGVAAVALLVAIGGFGFAVGAGSAPGSAVILAGFSGMSCLVVALAIGDGSSGGDAAGD